MSKKTDAYFFNNFIACAEYAAQAARMLEQSLKQFDPASLEARMTELHQIEHAADDKKHELSRELARAFITPIEREDIVELAQQIDNVTDCIEDVLIRMYMHNIRSVRGDAIEFTELLIQCCDMMVNMLREFPEFRHSRRLHEYVVQINSLEEACDRIFIQAVRKLHVEPNEVLEVVGWREIYAYLEKCADACEHVAGVVETVTMKNS